MPMSLFTSRVMMLHPFDDGALTNDNVTVTIDNESTSLGTDWA